MVEVDRVGTFVEQWRRERPDLDPSPMAVIGRMRRVSDDFSAALVENYRRYGIGEGEFDVLCALRRAGAPFALNQGDLAEHTMVTAGATSKRVDRLESAGLVSRHLQADDGRGRVVTLSPQGRRLIDEAYPEHLQLEEQLLSPLSRNERTQLEALLRKLVGG
ncbi:MarR family winged helix-turn-helix transcriptional regulator [Isoptericola sp. NPDC057191]|uniref:MarR family winged helix-turn-helix transcriptional regulator n=1 Tax=Isoptericola sp. NPDC057191 TaxID=3346041 RepID=UPI003643092D